MMSAETTPPDPSLTPAAAERRKRDRRLQQLEDARAKRWRGTTAEHRKAFAVKLSEAAKASRAGKSTSAVKTIQIPKVSISIAAYDRICRNAIKSRWSMKSIIRHILETHS